MYAVYPNNKTICWFVMLSSSVDYIYLNLGPSRPTHIEPIKLYKSLYCRIGCHDLSTDLPAEIVMGYPCIYTACTSPSMYTAKVSLTMMYIMWDSLWLMYWLSSTIPFFVLSEQCCGGLCWPYTWNFYSGSMFQAAAMQRMPLTEKEFPQLVVQ